MTQKIKIAKNVKANFRPNSARAKYWEVFQTHNGKSLESFVKGVAASPPSVPNRGKLAGKAEPAQGWVSFFVRNGYATLSDK